MEFIISSTIICPVKKVTLVSIFIKYSYYILKQVLRDSLIKSIPLYDKVVAMYTSHTLRAKA